MPRPVNERQIDVLQWIADGCPAGRWPADDSSHKVSAAALRSRGLVTVKGHGPNWMASITEAGRHYLEHGEYPDGQRTAERRRPRRRRAVAADPLRLSEKAAETLREAETLVNQIQDEGGTLTVSDPSESTRAHYRRLLHACREHKLVPVGLELRYTGRDSGDIVISVGPASAGATSDWLRIRTTARRVTTNIELLRTALETSSVLDTVSEDLRPRATDVVVLLAQELVGHGLRLGVNVKLRTPKLFVQTDTRRRDLTLTEILKEVPHVRTAAEEREARRSPWKTFPSVDQVPSGRLRLTVARDGWTPAGGSNIDEWSDSLRSPLNKQVREIAAAIKTGIVEDKDVRDREAQRQAEAHERWQREQAEARRVWEELLQRATTKATDQVRRSIFSSAYDDWRTAHEIRTFCAALEAATLTGEPGKLQTLHSWIAWARREADDLDPVQSLDRLDGIDFDLKPTDADIKPFMNGMSTAGPHRDYSVPNPPAQGTTMPEPRPWHHGMRGKTSWWRH